MSDQSATAQEETLEDSTILSTEDQKNSQEHSDESDVTEEETPENNDPAVEDSNGAPETEGEEEDPLKKAKAHADRKIAELGTKASHNEKIVIEAVKRNPEMLIDLYEGPEELRDRNLADRIRNEYPDVFAKADLIYKQRLNLVVPAVPAVAGAPIAPLSEAAIQAQVEKIILEREAKTSKSTALAGFRDRLGYSATDFSTIEPKLRSVAESISSANSDISFDVAIERAFLAMFPGDFEQDVQKKTLVQVSQKMALQSGGGRSAEGDLKAQKISKSEEEAWKVSGLSKERYLELKSKGLIQ